MHHRLLILLTVFALASAGCGTDEDPTPEEGEVPEGWEVVEAAGYTVAVPPGWSAEQDGTVVDLAGPDAPLDSRVQLRAGVPEGITAAEALDVAVVALEFELDDIEPVGDVETWAPTGADDGALVELTYDQQVGGETLRIAELTGIAVGQGVQLKVRALDRADRFDEVRSTLRQLLDSVRLVGAAETPEEA